MNIGIIGLGNMGFPLFKKLIRNNFNVNVLIEKNNTQKLIKCNVYKQNNLNDFVKSVCIDSSKNRNTFKFIYRR